MNNLEYEKFKIETIAKTFAQQEQFYQWLRKLFYLNNELYKEYHSIYQDSFYVIYYELITEGFIYSQEILKKIEKSDNKDRIEFFRILTKGLTDIKSIFSESELQFIEYKRHNASHIFQNHYEKRLSPKGNLINSRKGKSIEQIQKELDIELIEKGFDSGFDDYMTHKLNPLITNLYNQLQKKNEI